MPFRPVPAAAPLIERGDKVTVGDIIGMVLAWSVPPVGMVVCWLALRHTTAWSSRRRFLVSGLLVGTWWTLPLVGIVLGFLTGGVGATFSTPSRTANVACAGAVRR